ncbi:MAG TPA: GPP34 family phosphoprotein, partial [Prolixibacteraceae bacterium]|nr:GPP34 family phosphoprotein [Prolixibacteraceae bacterium]
YYLLSLDPKNGHWLRMGNEFKIGLLGAVLADLYFAKRIGIDQQKVILVDPAISNYPFFDALLNLLQRKGSLKIWSLLSRMNIRYRFYKKEILKILVDNNDVLKISKSFWGIPYSRYYAKNRDDRNILIRRLRDIILRNEQPHAHELLLLTVIYASRMYKNLTDMRSERKIIKQKMKEMFKNGPSHFNNYEQAHQLEKGIRKAIQAANARQAAST